MSEPDRPDDEPGASRPGGAAGSGSVDVSMSDPELPASASASGSRPRRSRARTIPELAAQLGDAVVHTGDKVLDTVVRAGSKAGESLAHLPVAQAVMPKTRRGRVMAKSVVVSFLLVFSWIAVIVGLQLRRPRPPDFRPLAEQALILVRDGRAGEVYRDASSRFQEVVREDTFVANMEDLNRTLGRYKEITAVLATEIVRGPSGRTGRFDFRADYVNGPVRGSISYRWEDERWKLLGFSVDLPPELVIPPEERKQRVKGPDAELAAAAQALLELSAKGDYEAMWKAAAPGFQQSISLENFEETERERRKVLGPFDRILNVTSSRQNPNRTGASAVLLIQFEKATINGYFDFTKIDDVWKMTFYKLIVPLPRVPK